MTSVGCDLEVQLKLQTIQLITIPALQKRLVLERLRRKWLELRISGVPRYCEFQTQQSMY
jgi:hypothetical protein